MNEEDETIGDRVIWITNAVETVAADDDGSVYRLFKSVPSNLTPVEIDITMDGKGRMLMKLKPCYELGKDIKK